MYSDRFDDSEFDIEEALMDLEESVNLYDESMRDDLINRGRATYDRIARRNATLANKELGRKFKNYEKSEQQYNDHVDRGFQYDPLAADEQLTNYKNYTAKGDAAFQKRKLDIEEEYNARMRQASTREEKRAARQAKRDMIKALNNNMTGYKTNKNEMMRTQVGKNQRQKEAIQRNAYNQKTAELNNLRTQNKAEYMDAAKAAAAKDPIYSKKYTKVDPNTGMSKLDRKALRNAYKEMDAEQDAKAREKQLASARRNGYFGQYKEKNPLIPNFIDNGKTERYNQKVDMKNRLAAKGKLPLQYRGFDDMRM